MMLTDEELELPIGDTLAHIHKDGWKAVRAYARAVIKANNAKVLADLKPTEKAQILESFDAWELYRADNKPQYYPDDQVSALIQRNAELEAWLEVDATCPCCGESVKCLDGCTFVTDAPHDYEKMQEVRNVLKATS